jgi:hypothetical protein
MNQFKSSYRILTGDEELDKSLTVLRVSIANKVAKAALSAGVKLGAKKAKLLVPAKHKTVRSSIRGYVKTKKGKTGKYTVAKYGACGKPKKDVARGSTKGVGISSQNIHWWILGTDDRYNKTKKPRYTGQMPANPVIRESYDSGALMAAIRDQAVKTLNKEVLRVTKK